MVKLLGLEMLLMILTSLYAMFVIPAVYGLPSDVTLLVVGLLMSLAFVGLYAITNLASRKMPWQARATLAVLAYYEAFSESILLVVRGVEIPGPPLYYLTPALFGLLLVGVALWKAQPGERINAAGSSLFAYALPVLGIQLLLAPLAGPTLAGRIAIQAGALYLLLRGLLRIFAPTSAEGNAEATALIHRPVPDRIVGLVEGTTKRRARPFATRPDGTLDESAISLLCKHEELEGIQSKVRQALKTEPFSVEAGRKEKGQVEIVIRPAAAGELTQS